MDSPHLNNASISASVTATAGVVRSACSGDEGLSQFSSISFLRTFLRIPLFSSPNNATPPFSIANSANLTRAPNPLCSSGDKVFANSLNLEFNLNPISTFFSKSWLKDTMIQLKTCLKS